jgi:ArsR family transcriptional regulator, arsenate/arsenite/antimonite-responsive transcriptional repressor
MIDIDYQSKGEPTRAQVPERFDGLSTWLKALAEPNRLRIADLLMQGEQCNCDMGGKLSMAPNLVSHHLRVLQDAGLIVMRRDLDDARWIHYSINQNTLAALNQVLGTFFNPARIQPQQTSCAPTRFFFQAQDSAAGDR